MNQPQGKERTPGAWVSELAKFAGSEMKVLNRLAASTFLSDNRQAVLERTARLPPDLPPALHFDPRCGDKYD